MTLSRPADALGHLKSLPGRPDVIMHRFARRARVRAQDRLGDFLVPAHRQINKSWELASLSPDCQQPIRCQFQHLSVQFVSARLRHDKVGLHVVLGNSLPALEGLTAALQRVPYCP